MNKHFQLAKNRIRPYYSRIRRFGFSRKCPICKSSLSRFLPFGVSNIRDDVLCPVCGSLERHRLIAMFFKNQRDRLFNKKSRRFLHIAPEASIRKIVKRIGKVDYLSLDLNSKSVSIRGDLTSLCFPDKSIDMFYCSHVLEHIPADTMAMKEIRRILKDDGWAILQVPLDENRESTFEDPTIVSEDDRLRVFGHPDHVRIYGTDYAKRLKEAGFIVERIDFAKQFSHGEKIRYGFGNNPEKIHFCQPNNNPD